MLEPSFVCTPNKLMATSPATAEVGLAKTGRQASATHRSRPARHWRGDPYRDRARWYLLVCLIVTVVMFVVAESVDRPTDFTDEAPNAEPAARRLIEYVSSAGGYRFIYPRTWDLRDEGELTRVTSLDGTIHLSFGPRPSGEHGLSSSPLLGPFDPELSHERVIGSRWERIGGSRSLLIGGTATEATGRRVRFLDISVGAEPQDYAITIVVPFRSDPEEVLPKVEKIVSSFEIIGVEEFRRAI